MKSLRATLFGLLLASALACCGAFAGAAAAQPGLDANFAGGVVTPKAIPNGKWPQVARGAAIQADGKVVAPISLSVRYGQRAHRPVVRYGLDGKLDPSYGKGGVAWVRLRGVKFFGFTGISLQADGRALVLGTGSAHKHGPWRSFVARLDSSGQLDRSFGDDGVTYLPASAVGYLGLLSATELETGGTLLVSGDDEGDFMRLIRLKGSGNIDRAYGDRGVKDVLLARHVFFVEAVDTRVHGDTIDVLALFDTGRISCKVLRTSITSHGGPVNTFGDHGWAKVPAAIKGQDDGGCGSLAAASDGGVAVAGDTLDLRQDLPYGGYITKFRPDGKLDSSFGTAGIALTGSNTYGSSAALTGDGSYLLAGANMGERDTDTARGALLELDSAGRAVPTFGAAGFLALPLRGIPGKFSQSAAGSVVVFTKYLKKGFGSSQIVKLTN
jgi:uncharacterized delta-60 repeat protein